MNGWIIKCCNDFTCEGFFKLSHQRTMLILSYTYPPIDMQIWKRLQKGKPQRDGFAVGGQKNLEGKDAWAGCKLCTEKKIFCRTFYFL